MLATCKKNTNYNYIVFYDLIGTQNPPVPSLKHNDGPIG